MITYLINTTIIWLLCLLAFDALLRRETYHALNRVYLLLSLVMGLLVPAIPMQERTENVAPIIMQRPMHTITTTRQTIVEHIAAPAPSVHNSFNWNDAIQWLYLAGVAVSVLLLLKDVVVVMLYYKKGNRSKEGRWTVIETGKPHGPFSLFRLLFVSSREQYDNQQWQIILKHEQEHTRRLHFADLMLMQLVQIAFWFHPLVYLFRKRLLLVHEYQADAVGAAKPKAYGKFLIEQSMLNSAPLVAHSFNQSPIQNRIRMLTRSSSSRIHMLKLGIILPLISFSFLFCVGKQKDGDYKLQPGKDPQHKLITFRGNTIEVKVADSLRLYAKDPATGKEITMHPMSFVPVPERLNGNYIYYQNLLENYRFGKYSSAKIPELSSGKLAILYLLDKIKDDVKALDDGYYSVSVFPFVVDEQGNVAYYNQVLFSSIPNPFGKAEPPIKGRNAYEVLTNMQKDDSISTALSTPLDKGIKEQIQSKLRKAVDEMKFTPASVNGRIVPYNMDLEELGFDHVLKVKGHHVEVLSTRGGC